MPVSIFVNFGSPVPAYQQIFDQVRTAVVAGRLVDEEPLPSIRDLAEELTINPNTVARAYTELAREGITESRGTRGHFVKVQRKQYTRAERRRRIDPLVRAFVSEALFLGYSTEEIRDEAGAIAEELSPARSGKTRGGSR